jgi:hypothetical protein
LAAADAREFYRAGQQRAGDAATAGSGSSWCEMGDLTEEEAEVRLEQFQGLLREVEVTPMTKSFKMVLLEACWSSMGFGQARRWWQQLAQRSRNVLDRRRPLLAICRRWFAHLPDGHDRPRMGRYWRDNPINAWTGGNRARRAAAPFKLEGSVLALRRACRRTMVPALAAMLQELVDYRLAAYEVRLEPSRSLRNVVPFPPGKRADAVELPYFPNLKIACGHFQAGRTDAEEHRTLPTAYGRWTQPPLHRARHRGTRWTAARTPCATATTCCWN